MTGGRPTSVAEMRDALSRFGSAQAREQGLAYRPAPSDVFIAPYAKCGTTWMQQIVHGLRTGGSMDFDEITEATPWIELAHDLGLDIHGPQAAPPKAFKSHLCWDEIPKGGRYIVVMRDPVDAMLSMHRFFEGWFFETGAIGVEAFAREFYLERDARSYWAHAASWLRERRRPEVLLTTYEAMKRDLTAVVDRVAAFIGVHDAAAREIATAQAGLAFMTAHGRQFDDHLVRARCDAGCGLPPGAETSKVKSGVAGGGRGAVSPALRQAFDDRWSETIAAEFGFPDYAALDHAVGVASD